MHNLILIAVAALAVVLAATLARGRLPRAAWRDPRRDFTAAERSAIFARAGGRCEHRGFVLRCRRAAQHADHISPWATGGPTSVANAQALCARHNLSKGARRPSRWYIARLERARRRYFPPGAAVDVLSRHR